MVLGIPEQSGESRSRGGPAPLTVGVEEEFLLVDPDTRRVVPCGEEVAAARGICGESRVTVEMGKGQVEANSVVCTDMAELRADLLRLRQGLAHRSATPVRLRSPTCRATSTPTSVSPPFRTSSARAAATSTSGCRIARKRCGGEQPSAAVAAAPARAVGELTIM